MPDNKPLPTMPGKTWQPMEVFNLRARHPETCWEPINSRREVCALLKPCPLHNDGRDDA